jgi:hypothetical protein
MSIEIIECEQGSEGWFLARMGIPTASEFQTLLMSGRGGGESKTRATYIKKLAGEIITGEPMEHFSNGYTDRGHAMEAEAREMYAFAHDAELTQVGFIKNCRKGCSPDSLAGNSGGVEVKTKAPHILIDVLEKNEIPNEHVAQLQGFLYVAEREWIDLVCYWPKMPLFVKRSYRDEVYIAKLSRAIDEFNEELDTLVAKVRSYG